MVVGHGIAGFTAARILADSGAAVTVVTEETRTYYYRPRLPDFIAGRADEAELVAFPDQWYAEKGIHILLGHRVDRVEPRATRVVLDSGETLPYDRLLLATGGTPFLPPIEGLKAPGVMTVRTLEDARRIKEMAKAKTPTVVLGGGLLGLEIAAALAARGASTTVLESSDRLLGRQLDKGAADILLARVRQMGLEVWTGVDVERVVTGGGTEGGVTGAHLAEGRTVKGNLILVTAGVRPNLDLARAAGLSVNRGVVVDGFLRTSDERIFAAGDCAEWEGQTWGTIPAAVEQARVAAAAMMGKVRVPYTGTIPSNSLKIAGMDLTSLGDPEAEPGPEELIESDADRGVYKKLMLRDGRLAGAIWLGDKMPAAVSKALGKEMAWDEAEKLVGRKKRGLAEPSSGGHATPRFLSDQ